MQKLRFLHPASYLTLIGIYMKFSEDILNSLQVRFCDRQTDAEKQYVFQPERPETQLKLNGLTVVNETPIVERVINYQ